MPDAKYASLKTPFPFRQHPIQPPSATNAKHQILDQKIKGLLNDIEQFLKKQMYTAVYPLIRNFVRFASRKRELQKRIQLELEILSFQQQQILERLQEMEKMEEHVRELLVLVKALSERETEIEMGREDFESLARRLDLLSGLFERNFISAPTKSSSIGSEINKSLDSLEEDASAYDPFSLPSVPPEPSTPEDKQDKKKRNLDVTPSVSDDDEFPFSDISPPVVLFELSAPGGTRRKVERESEQLNLHRYGGRTGASLTSPLKRLLEYRRLKAERERLAAAKKGKQKA